MKYIHHSPNLKTLTNGILRMNSGGVRMNIDTFIQEYDLHDSLIENIQINDDQLVLDIDLCNWRQKRYIPEESEMRNIKVVFDNVQNYQFEGAEHQLDSDSILHISCSGVPSAAWKKIKLVFENNGIVKIMTFESDRVIVKDC